MYHQPLKGTVECYYDKVDNHDYEGLLTYFADDIIYRRCQRIITGKAALRHFYLKVRNLGGTHSIETLVEKGNLVIVEGRFEGTKGRIPFEVQFADFFRFNKDQLIQERHTYTNQGKV